MPTKLDVINLVAIGGVVLEVLLILFLGVLYSTYARFAQSYNSGLPVLARLKITAYVIVGFVVLNTLMIILSVWWLFGVQDWQFVASVVLFVIEILLIPLLALVLVITLFK